MSCPANDQEVALSSFAAPPLTLLPPDLARRLAAEFVGTTLLLATVVGSGMMGERLAAFHRTRDEIRARLREFLAGQSYD